MSLTAETGAGSPPALYKREAGRFAEYRRELATRLIVGDTVVVACLLYLAWHHKQSSGNPILAESRPISSKPIRKTNIDEHNFFRRRRLLQESPCNKAREIQRCQEMLADRPTNFQIGLTADVARVTKIRWP